MQLYNKSCYGLTEIEDNSVEAVVTDPPYGISYQGHEWDQALPDVSIWSDAYRVLKPGGLMLVFSAIRLQHRITTQIEDAGFNVRDVVMWGFLNGMPKSRDVGLEIDKVLGIESEIVGEYKYVQGYKKGGSADYYADEGKKIKSPSSETGKRFAGFGNGIKPAYEPIILFQKPIAEKTVAKNIIEHGVGALNLEETRIPYAQDDKKVGHNPHPKGRVMANLIRTEEFLDGMDKYFTIPKVRQYKDDFNTHPTLKPIYLMEQLVKLVSAEGQTILDPFMGSGSTGVAAVSNNRNFIGYEISKEYFEIAKRRFDNQQRTRGNEMPALL